jgi:hypothetical protein
MDTSIPDPSATSRPVTCADTPKCIALPASVAGPKPCSSQGGHQPDLFGPAVVRASHSATPGSTSVTRTSATSGPSSSISSASAALSMSLASRLQAQLAKVGSMEYRQTWKRKRTPAGRWYWAHIASARRIHDKDYTGWPTVTCTDGVKRGQVSLRPGAMCLSQAVQLTGWATPTVQDSSNTAGPSQFKRNSLPLNCEVTLVPGTYTPSPTAPTGKRGVLAPEFARWLQGYRAEWGLSGDTAMRSFRK